MEDVQSGPSEVAMPIDRVGVKGLKHPLTIRDRKRGSQNTVAEVDLSADLPARFKGTHMSRFVEALGEFKGDLDRSTLETFLADLADKLEADSAHARFRFPYFLRQSAPATGSPGLMHYECVLDGEWRRGALTFTLEVAVPVMTVCPCSKAIAEEGAHSQRAVVRIRCRFEGFVWLEELIKLAEASASCRVYSVLKREDEKMVTETAFANPRFVEDVVRGCAQGLAGDGRFTWFRVEVESFESIHNHSAFASIERTLRPKEREGTI
ncbi:GTP cyclohydrolase FolE2 [Desulfohalovibrio reitneri]|uniref:GTP cyclohydrolase FolE2 n=1 Tax=Desulfohalovibrio reitneri TaxID=1307759 RepID=UPI0004A76C2B|nr:GTP cyclohydrolase FolE2 [Desulfohalovibrio reitneri]